MGDPTFRSDDSASRWMETLLPDNDVSPRLATLPPDDNDSLRHSRVRLLRKDNAAPAR